MVEATDFANRDDLAEFRPLNSAAVGRILVEREVSTLSFAKTSSGLAWRASVFF